MKNDHEEHYSDDEWAFEDVIILQNTLAEVESIGSEDDTNKKEGGTSKPPTMKNHHEEHRSDYGWTSEDNMLVDEAYVVLESIGSGDDTDESEGDMSNPPTMKDHHEEHHLNDGWTSEDMKILESALEDDTNEEIGSTSKKRRVIKRPRAKAIPWTEKEHKLFLMGLKRFGKGNWKAISKFVVTNKTPTQVASHAQKFMNREHNCTPFEKLRRSINDIRDDKDFDFSNTSTNNQMSYVNCPPNTPQNLVHPTFQHSAPDNISSQFNMPQNLGLPTSQYSDVNIINFQSNLPYNFVSPNIQHFVPNNIGSQSSIPQNFILPTFQHPTLNINFQLDASQNFVPHTFQHPSLNQVQQPHVLFNNNWFKDN